MMGMSNEQILEFNRGVIEQFRNHDGVMPEGSPFHGNPTLLLTMTGAKSGRSLVTPLTYTVDTGHPDELGHPGGALIVMASAGGSPTAPAWAFNLRANPEVTVEVLGETYAARASETAGDERQRVFDLMVANLPRFADYQEAVDREIPLFRLVRS